MDGIKDSSLCSTGAGLVTGEEVRAALHCIEYGMSHGASGIRVSLSKSVLDSFTVLNGELDKVMHSADRSLFLYIFADGRYGTFSTNNFSIPRLEDFISKALDTVKMLAPDPCRKLPDPGRKAHDAVTGQELHLYDPEYQEISPEQRLKKALDASIFRTAAADGPYTVISEECEYSDSVDDNFLADSDGFRGRHTETSFAVCSEMTIQDSGGRKLSGYWWESSPFFSGLDISGCSRTALEKAAGMIGPEKHKGGKYCMVVDRSVSSRLAAPLLSALNGAAVQQKNSFLENALGQKLFPEKLCIMDLARSDGKPGSRLYDTEGVATKDTPVIENGIVKEFFVNTYIAGKTGLQPTVDSISRPSVKPFTAQGYSSEGRKSCVSEEKEINLPRILKLCGSGIYVTGFNGGNCNPVTGDFSYGIEGFAFRNGRITHPIREMVATGNMVSLWSSIIAAGSDARECTRWQIPTLAFSEVNFSA